MASRPNRTVLAAFLVFVVFAGANAIGVRFALREMGPFWSAAIRFAVAGLLLAVYMVATRRPVPRGNQLVGRDRDPALFGNQKRVHDVHPVAHVTQQAGNERSRYRRRVDVYQFARKFQSRFSHRTCRQLRMKPAETFSHHEIGLQCLQRLLIDCGQIHCAAQGPRQEEVSHLFRDRERNTFLRFSR